MSRSYKARLITVLLWSIMRLHCYLARLHIGNTWKVSTPQVIPAIHGDMGAIGALCGRGPVRASLTRGYLCPNDSRRYREGRTAFARVLVGWWAWL